MDALAQLALMTKANLMFAKEGTFLSFPALSPLSLLPEHLQPEGKVGAGERLRAMAELSRITNQIPESVLFQPGAEEYLWDVYHDVLERAQLAPNGSAGGEGSTCQKARDFLYRSDLDGLRTESEALRRYREHRDALIVAQEDYKGRQITAENSDDPAERQCWQTTDEPACRSRIEELERAWIIRGFKREVEDAQLTEQACASKSPALTWSQWKGLFNPDLDMLADENGARFAITTVSPSGILEGGDWPRFTLGPGEISGLGQRAPTELAALLGAPEGGSDIQSISFECRSVGVTRSWFKPAALAARFWRLTDDADRLSDGGDPPGGRCPAYVTAIVLARRVEVLRKQNAKGSQRISPGALLTLPKGSLLPRAIVRARIERRSATPRPSLAVRPALPPARAKAPQPSVPGSTDVPRSSPSASWPREMAILALICKRLPRCPDPDVDLSWPP